MVEKLGEIRVADQVIAVIAGVAVEEVLEVSVRSGGLYQDLAKKINGGSKGISVSMVEDKVTIDMRVSVKYGAPIHHVCHTLQEKVKDAVETLTGLWVDAINVRVETIEIK
ncbi:Asp23/Gls24 family envelope stress response protein [Brevibacillus nitrificans]|uniref:Asp23/Gls24 family envelope stress response protein n=1 Tax=Brevibacillus nitrificans TaxID=651560 RepID=A0A3M8DM82_9BACL|nr:Asp23/Gls24 family envelope stress response protein [Brevibacillus nitrificans]MDR7314174.1 putative alkaline shock family protein YloU [Brevibacillus nitrificans]RNB89176.1 Asp23/Gls24 family envelope stress response protein [Brevibacillus nitrificans]